jgi:hypothetical protein
MKISREWKKLTQEQRRAWNAWAKSNKVLLDDGNVRRVSGGKALTMVVRNRTVAGEATNPSVIPAAVAWLDNVLHLTDAGPFTENNGFVGFRAATDITTATTWFVWASPPVPANEPKAHRLLRFLGVLSLPPMAWRAWTPDLGPNYLQVHGSWDGPGIEGEWPEDTFIWFRLHQYANGQLGPGTLMQGRIQIEL